MPSLSPVIAEIRLAVRIALADLPQGSTVVVALSGGADSLALAAATAFEGPKLGLRVASLTVDQIWRLCDELTAAHGELIPASLRGTVTP